MPQRRLAILGLGNFGEHFARSVRDMGFDLLTVDGREEAVNRVAQWVSRSVVADVTDRAALEELGLAEFDIAVVSLGDRMERSTLCVLHLKSLGVKEIYVKAVSPDHARILEALGATRIIHPEREVAEALARSIGHPNVIRFLPLAGSFAILEIRTPDDFAGRTLRDLQLRKEHGLSVIAMSPSGDHNQLQAPAPDEPLKRGSLLVLIGTTNKLERFEKSFGG